MSVCVRELFGTSAYDLQPTTMATPETAMTLESKLNRKLSFSESHPENGCEILYIIEFLVKHTHVENLCIQLPKT